MKRVWISGPMTGYKNYNYASFDLARDELRAAGFDPVSPADLDRQHYGPDIEFATEISKDQRREMMVRDLVELSKCDAVYVLAGWLHSKGSGLERHAADYFGIPEFFEINDGIRELAAYFRPQVGVGEEVVK